MQEILPLMQQINTSIIIYGHESGGNEPFADYICRELECTAVAGKWTHASRAWQVLLDEISAEVRGYTGRFPTAS
jgi:hypothetical protein